jgi:hypothetical protein
MASGERFGHSPPRSLALSRHHRSRRASSWDRTGANLDRRALPAGSALTLPGEESRRRCYSTL